MTDDGDAPDLVDDETAGPLSGRDVAYLLTMPMLVFFAMQVHAMAAPSMVDPWFYTAYATNPRGLMLRYGPTNYYWVRLGALVPSMLGARLFGPVPGFYVVRYVFMLVATTPVYLLFKREHGRRAAQLAALVVLTSPVLLVAWGTDYPDAAAVTYLLAGLSALLLDRGANHRRWWVAGCGVLTLAVHSQAAAASLVAGSVLVVIAWAGGGRKLAAGRAALAALTAAVTTLGVALIARVVFLNFDIVGPSLDQLELLDEQRDIWHTDGVAWLWDVSYLLVPLVVLGLCVVVGWATRPNRGSLLTAFTWILAVQFATAAVFQFLWAKPTLEFHLWSSMLWPAVLLALVAGIIRLTGNVSRRLTIVWGVVFALPLVLGHRGDLPRLGWSFWALAGATSVVLGAFLAVRARPSAARTAVACWAVIVALALTVAPVPARASTVPLGRYTDVFDGPATVRVDQYRVATELSPFIESQIPQGEAPLLWWEQTSRQLLNPPAAQYLWALKDIGANYPELTDQELEGLQAADPTYLILLATSEAALDQGVAGLRAEGLDSQVMARKTFRSNDVSYSAAVVRLR